MLSKLSRLGGKRRNRQEFNRESEESPGIHKDKNDGSNKVDEYGDNFDRETIVIGEGMADRVIPTARDRGASWYDPPDAPPDKWMENNRNWIIQKMNVGCRILDCGPDPSRENFPEPTSRFYKMERDEIKRREYQFYERIQAKGE